MKRLLLIISAAILFSGCEAFVHPYDQDWYENPCKWYEGRESGWYCKRPPADTDNKPDKVI
ncbi:hypothetical protein NB640_06790 [Oxalobacter vibrioformis]|uniref:Lipoprotein n=1 Tax=Oxalobacter vibrioformis TaxID=933080 RepID=A0A9E9P2H0_9BURK|nr:hypothetical protein [Oxalobacter vibrioformis]WAW08998.1 hypothetical protein NB640_06790 [Oxalobacter vibrioformis]